MTKENEVVIKNLSTKSSKLDGFADELKKKRHLKN